ncbi:MAG: PKD domain-containing protein [Candidatus Hadarchaeales archaeon]
MNYEGWKKEGGSRGKIAAAALATIAITAVVFVVYFTMKAPGFSVSLSPEHVSVDQGSSATAVLTVDASGGYGENVSLTVIGEPQGVTISFSQPGGKPSFSSIMTINVGATAQPGTHEITIIVRGPGGMERSCVLTLTVNEIPNEPPVAGFSFSPSSPTTADNVQFTDNSADPDGTVSSWSWDFGDGSTSTQKNPVHRYASAGTYTITLTVTDDKGATGSASREITVANLPPTAGFVYASGLLLIDDDIQFTDNSTDSDGTIVSWSWNFGDGSTSTQRNPTHRYASAGTYTVRLTVTDDKGATDNTSRTVQVVPPSRVQISNYQVIVNGSPFTIKGVCYSPTPVGSSVEWGFSWWAYSDTYTNDFPMLRDMGANTIRTYSAVNASRGALDAAYNSGIYVIMGYWVDWSADLSNSSVRQGIINGFVSMVRTWKNHPAVLMWALGNEMNYHASPSRSYWYSLLQEAAQAAHSEEGQNYHPVITVEGEIGSIGSAAYGSDDASLTALDAWGVSAYRGQSFGNLFSDYRSKTSKPLILAEWGCDALDARTQTENPSTQAAYIESLWNEISSNLGPSGRCLGGTLFEWSDEWWKAGNPSSHDTTAGWASGGYYDYVAGQNNMNEEWWGITSISSGTFAKTPRQAYYTLKSLWT